MKGIINQTLILAVALVSTLTNAEAQSSARLRLKGAMQLTTNTCNVQMPAQVRGDFLIKRNTYTISVEDKENNITDPNAIGVVSTNTILADKDIPGSNGRYIWYQLMIKDVVRINNNTPKPLVTMMWNVMQGNNMLCSTIYKGRLNRN